MDIMLIILHKFVWLRQAAMVILLVTQLLINVLILHLVHRSLIIMLIL